jgi:GTP-binding protein
MSLTPTVAIVGRPNVGKSTLFNRMVGRRQAIVHDKPGVTRDRITGTAQVDDERSVQVIDTGGLVPGDDPLGLGEQVDLAVQESDLLLLVVDGREGLTPGDQTVWEHLRRQAKPTVLVVNKGDTNEAKDRFNEFYRLGISPQLLVSSEHAIGIGDIFDAIEEALPELPKQDEIDAPAVAIIGRPNVGKSSIVNRILGHSRSLVSPVAGTTRDPVDTLVERDGKEYLLIDTAGIRRRSQVTDTPEELAVMMARRQIERSRVVVLVIDAAQGVTTGDLAIAGAAWDMGRAVVVAINKWDLLDPESRQDLEESWPRLEQLTAKAPRVNVSAETGRGIEKIFPAIDRVLEAHGRELGTGELNRMLEEAIRRNSPPIIKNRPWRMYYATQVTTAPPTFMIFANSPLARSDTYRRYLENRMRANLELPGVPIRLVIRGREPKKMESSKDS